MRLVCSLLGLDHVISNMKHKTKQYFFYIASKVRSLKKARLD